MAQINTPSSHKTMIAVFVAIAYSNQVRKWLDNLKRTENTLTLYPKFLRWTLVRVEKLIEWFTR